MRTITEFAEQPNEVEVKVVGDRASVFIRTDITSEETEDGTKWIAVEYTAQVNANKFEPTEKFIESLIARETELKADEVRKKRNKLLDASDKEVLPDRLSNYEAWAAYRQALRDISKQEGFPFDVEFPVEPTNDGTPLTDRVSDLEDAVIELAEIITEG